MVFRPLPGSLLNTQFFQLKLVSAESETPVTMAVSYIFPARGIANALLSKTLVAASIHNDIAREPIRFKIFQSIIKSIFSRVQAHRGAYLLVFPRQTLRQGISSCLVLLNVLYKYIVAKFQEQHPVLRKPRSFKKCRLCFRFCFPFASDLQRPSVRSHNNFATAALGGTAHFMALNSHIHSSSKL
jgi:hypothetical protein